MSEAWKKWWEENGRYRDEDHGILKQCFEDAQPKWQPIETAPKDGFHIQLYRPEIQFVGYWADAGWCMQGCKSIDPAPTHWKPLTDSPAEKNDASN